MAKRREYGEGSIYQRCRPGVCPDLVDGSLSATGKPTRVRPDHKCTGLWVASVEVVASGDGKRRRISVAAKTRPLVVKKLRDKKLAIEENGTPTQHARTTVAQWATTWLEMKKTDLSPRGWNAAASPIRKWIVPTIGHRRLSALTPADIRAVADAQRDAGRKGATAAATHRTLLNMLRSAIVEGHQVPQRVLLVKAPKASVSDRMDVPVDQAAACLAVASLLPHGTRWALALLFGVRQGEALGLTWDMVDFDRDEIRIEWQLDNLPYVDRKRKHLGFRVPAEYECRHLVDAWHLVRPKSKKGFRVLPMTPAWRQAMLDWRDAAPANAWGLVWPTADGRPANDKHDLAEWHAIQGAASLTDLEPRTDLRAVPVGHPGGRYFHIHECRNYTATQLGEAGVDPEVIKSLLGHSTAAQSGEYRRIHRMPKLEALALVAGVAPFQVPPPSPQRVSRSRN